MKNAIVLMLFLAISLCGTTLVFAAEETTYSIRKKFYEKYGYSWYDALPETRAEFKAEVLKKSFARKKKVENKKTTKIQEKRSREQIRAAKIRAKNERKRQREMRKAEKARQKAEKRRVTQQKLQTMKQNFARNRRE